MKCFERLVMAHINTIIALHTALSDLDKRNTYMKMLLIYCSSAFNTIQCIQKVFTFLD
jgi:ABC-type maltose transport system permease subunit